ncbi:MAG: peptide chain release factor N(5)-glutamine methyltransferase [Endomicrobia bacterium]|nr:peptide chain release factor N(5)-glutamine methyltransferase [Endomicrobiia bacterium]
MDVYSSLKNAEQILSNAGLIDAKSSAEVLLSHVLKIPRSKLPLSRTRKLLEQEFILFNEYILRRSKREPTAYITGSCGFMDCEFFVDRNVLIPRSETELLVEEAIKTACSHGGKSVLDLCTGSGCIAVSLAKTKLFKKITASDISDAALKTAAKNADLNGTENIEFVKSDVFENLNGKKFDIIISNPPYISAEEFVNLEPELSFEPEIALVTEDDGMFFYKKIALQAKRYLNDGGFVLLELNANKAEEIKIIFQEADFKDIEIINDYANLPRILKTKV